MSIRFSELSAVILAAGLSRRFGAENKLLHVVDGKPLVRRSIEPFLELGLREIVVVLGYQADLIERSLGDLLVRVVVNQRFEEGMGSSLAVGVESASREDPAGLFVSLADLPRLRAEEIRGIGNSFLAAGCDAIVLPTYGRQRGHPVCFPRRCFEALRQILGDQGAKSVIRSDSNCVELTLDHPGIIQDLDTR